MTPDRLALPALLLAAALMLQGCATAPSVPAGQESGTDAGAGTPAGTASAQAPPQAGVADAATHAQPTTEAASPPGAGPAPADSGLAIYEAFLAGLAEPGCDNAQARWRKHFAHAPRRLGQVDADTLMLFGFVVDSLREAGLPTEFALVPFIESGYAPGARSKAGPAGMWQFVGVTARHHGIRIEPGYDARLSPAESTRAAVQYLKSLHQRFEGNWRLTAMAYNAGEYRVLNALRKSGAEAATATPATLKGLAPVTYAYAEKLHALACLVEEAGEQPQWRAGLDQPVVRLQARPLEGARSLDAWARSHGQDAATLRRLNPSLAGRWPSRGAPWALVPANAVAAPASTVDSGPVPDDAEHAATQATHTVRKGDSAWSIAKRYGVSTRRLLELNGLQATSVLRPGMVLRVQ